MTKDRAIQVLQKIKETATGVVILSDGKIKAIDMAIESLSAEPSDDEYVPNKSCFACMERANGLCKGTTQEQSWCPIVAKTKAEPSEQYKKGFEDAKRAFELEYARESENMRKRNAQLEVLLNAKKAISAEPSDLVFRGGKIPPKEMLDGTVLIPQQQWLEMERELANLKEKFKSAEPSGDLISREELLKKLDRQIEWEEANAIPYEDADVGCILGLKKARKYVKLASSTEKPNANDCELISRADAINAVTTWGTNEERNGNVTMAMVSVKQRIVDLLSALPSADVIEVKADQLPPKVPTEWISEGMVLVPRHDWIGMQKKLEEYASAEAAHGYTKWLEKIVVEAETFERLCEDATDKEWCEKNCHYATIQAECLRHLYEVSKGGAK